MFENKIVKHFLETFNHISHGNIKITLPDGKEYDFAGANEGAHADLKISDIRMIKTFALKGDIGLAEAYRDGWWTSDDLTALFTFGLENEEALDNYIYGSIIARAATRIAYLFMRNTMSGSKKNIHAHYDIGNDFYSLWLDPSMTYSSAIFNNNLGLADAQNNKYDRIIDRLGDSGNLLEIGCGWGGFAERAIAQKDFNIKGLTISGKQHEYARNRLGQDANIALQDYRLEEGKYNQIVSIEMFEAVGESFWPIYFSKVKSLLADKGKAMIQTITIKEKYFERYRRGGDAIRTFIFPGGMLPSVERFEKASNHAGLDVNDRFMFGQDYARTLKCWLDNFENSLDEVKALGLDEKFIRIWRFYLTCCIASFTVGRTSVMQVELSHAS